MRKLTTSLAFLGMSLLSSNAMAADLPTKAFSSLPQYGSVSLSDSGSKLAFLTNIQDDTGDAATLMVSYDMTKGEKKYLLHTDNEDVKINWYEWANENTIIVSVRYAGSRYGTDTTETRLFAIDINGKDDKVEPRLLIKPRRSTGRAASNHFSQFQDNIINFLRDDPEHVLISIDLDEPHLPSVYKLNIYTKKMQRVEKGKRKIRDWTTDRQGNLRAGESLDYKSGEANIYVRKKPDSKWHKLFGYNALTDPSIAVSGFSYDGNTMYYTAVKDDMRSLFKVDLTTEKHELVFHDPEMDVSGRLIYSKKSGEVIGFSHANTDTGRIYWDEDRNVLQRSIDDALPDTDNYIFDFSKDENTYLLYTENDYTPGMYLIGKRKEKAINVLFSQYPELESLPDYSHDLISYTARDGVEIEGYLSKPPGTEGPRPLILFPHGGPGAREFAGFDYWTSFFLNKGYAVFRPNFRGSTGYGYEFAQQQMKSWGLQMQDDLTDAVNFLVKENVANKDKVCIVGGSYGGYAAAMGIAKEPDLFKCAVSFAGVADLKRLVFDARAYTSSKFVKNQIGDDYDDLEARSPINHMDKIKTPILLVHGEDDRVVDAKQSRYLAEELESNDKKFKYVELENGDHYLSIQRNRHRFFAEMDAFLTEHLD
ncbi:S9 family peptidase [Aestuariibacter sp. AA17]|uniref:S9 family peptidase n=1 Tax=Fluctibacter corallii TaxID=2984329 RepID=A0ABT3AAN7_9ALTE|nr:S9 family peptidase [Aestuariibacter sp. AA17]MCV2885746.1 S9 family peptidase [Aestuariibacter sp. AA17]